MPHAFAQPQTATLRLRWRDRLRVRVHVAVTPAGLLGVGGLVAAILLCVPPIVRAAVDARSGRAAD